MCAFLGTNAAHILSGVSEMLEKALDLLPRDHRIVSIRPSSDSKLQSGNSQSSWPCRCKSAGTSYLGRSGHPGQEFSR